MTTESTCYQIKRKEWPQPAQNNNLHQNAPQKLITYWKVKWPLWFVCSYAPLVTLEKWRNFSAMKSVVHAKITTKLQGSCITLSPELIPSAVSEKNWRAKLSLWYVKRHISGWGHINQWKVKTVALSLSSYSMLH